MKTLPERTYRSLFKATILIKGLIAVGEVALGFLFAFASYETLFRWVVALTGDELLETSKDFPWNYVTKAFHGFTNTSQSVWVFLLLSHGLVKLVLVGGLWKEKMWAYPWGAAVFTGFIIYQIYQMMVAPSSALLLITLLDVVVVVLTLHEYRYRLRHHKMQLQKQPLI